MVHVGEAADPLLGEVTSSKFVIRRLLGSGGMGAVFEAEHVLTKRIGALKLLHAHYAKMPEVVERFAREASAAGRINNPHIVETFDAGFLESGQPYIFMELLSGESLEARIAARGRLDFEEALAIATQAAIGLAAAHRAGIIHRDIKPANLFLVAGASTLVKLVDFGISKFASIEGGSRVTQEGTALGTPHYMAAEQLAGLRDIDERVDIYALGVVLYEAVSGKVPFDADTLIALSIRIHEGRYVPISQIRDDAPAGFDALMARCLAVDRNERYSKMSELITGLLSLSGRNFDSLAPTQAISTTAPPPRSSLPAPSQPSSLPPGVSAAGSGPGASGVAAARTVSSSAAGLAGGKRGLTLLILGAALLASGVFAWSRYSESQAAGSPSAASEAPSEPGAVPINAVPTNAVPTNAEAPQSVVAAGLGAAASNVVAAPDLVGSPEAAASHSTTPNGTSSSAPRPPSSAAPRSSIALPASSKPRAEPGGLKRDNPFD